MTAKTSAAIQDRFQGVSIRQGGGFDYHDGRAGHVRYFPTVPLFLIGEAWAAGVSFEDLADGFGPGLGTMGGDWSGIRDSSSEAVAAMFQRALNHFFGGNGKRETGAS